MTTVRALGLLIGITLVIGMLGACTAATSSEAPVETSEVNLPPSYRFEPAHISVSAGTPVTWTNNDNFTHSVEFLDGGLPTEPLVFEPGGSVTFTFDEPGVYHYQCSFHPGDMQGSITVTP
jgi:plastocyanin